MWLVRCDAIAEFMHVRELLDRLWGNNCFECYRLRLSGYFIYQRVFLLAFSLFFSFLLFLSPNPIALGKTSDNGGGGGAPCTITLERKGCVCGGIGTEGEREGEGEGESGRKGGRKQELFAKHHPHTGSSTRNEPHNGKNGIK